MLKPHAWHYPRTNADDPAHDDLVKGVNEAGSTRRRTSTAERRRHASNAALRLGFESCRRKQLACIRRRSAHERCTTQLPFSGKQLPIVANTHLVRTSKRDMNGARGQSVWVCLRVQHGEAGRPLNHLVFPRF